MNKNMNKDTNKCANKRMSKKFCLSLSEKLTLKVIRTGSDRINFKILEMLPNNINNIMKEIELTKVPTNVRINKLEKMFLVKRWRGTGLVVLTDIGKNFIGVINDGKEEIRPRLEEIIKRIVYESSRY